MKWDVFFGKKYYILYTKIFFFETSFSIVNITGFSLVIESPIRNSSLWWSSGFLSLLLWLCNLLLYSASPYYRRPPFRGPYQGKEDATKVEKKEDDEDNWDMPEDAPFWVYLAFNPHFDVFSYNREASGCVKFRFMFFLLIHFEFVAKSFIG